MERLSTVRGRIVGALCCAWLLSACQSTAPGAAGAQSSSSKPNSTHAATKLAAQAMPVRDTPLAMGEQAFDITGIAHNGQRVALSQFKDKPVVVYFCAHTAAVPCAELAAHLTRTWLELNYTLSMVFAVTAQDTLDQREWAIEHESPFLFLADADSKIRGAFGVAPNVFTSYLLDKERRVVAVWTPPQTGAHAKELEAALRDAGLLNDPYPL